MVQPEIQTFGADMSVSMGTHYIWCWLIIHQAGFRKRQPISGEDPQRLTVRRVSRASLCCRPSRFCLEFCGFLLYFTTWSWVSIAGEIWSGLATVTEHHRWWVQNFQGVSVTCLHWADGISDDVHCKPSVRVVTSDSCATIFLFVWSIHQLHCSTLS